MLWIEIETKLIKLLKTEQDICLLPALPGECHNYTQKWYFDSYEQRCRQFYYGGCGGNGNNFHSEHECTNRCQNPVHTPATPELEFQPGTLNLHGKKNTVNITISW